ncbi:Zn-ribbon domain-containing OB-fold protein [Aurantivibrio plasticivorans]
MSNTTLRPVDSPEGPDKQYADFIAAGKFMIQHCESCSQHVFYPRLICSHCGSDQLEWVEASGRGVVYSTSTPRGGKEGDYNISLIDLEEGPRMMSRVVDIAPGDVKIGLEVEAFIGEIDGVSLVLYKPALNGGEA